MHSSSRVGDPFQAVVVSYRELRACRDRSPSFVQILLGTVVGTLPAAETPVYPAGLRENEALMNMSRLHSPTG